MKVYYSQYDEPQASFPYPAKGYEKANGKTSACGPTSFAMVCASFGNKYTPIDAMKDSIAMGCRVPGGTLDSFFSKAAKKYEIPCEVTTDHNKAIQALNDNKLVVCRMKNWFAPGKGHFILAVGVKDGKIQIHDPASRANTSKLHEPFLFVQKCIKYFIFTNPKVYGIVTSIGLNVRSGAGILHKVIGALNQGERVQIIDSIKGWLKIDFKGKQGYVNEKYIRKE